MAGPPRRLLAGAACALALLALSTTAQAEEPKDTSTAPAPLSRERLRALVVRGRTTEARAAIAERLASDPPAGERAAILELLAVNESWRDGVPRAVDVEEGSTPPDWGSALDLARREIARGAYRSAARRLSALIDDAPNLVEASRAIELREIAREALAHQGAPPAIAEARAEQPAPPRKKEHWYGWQNLMADGSAILSAPVLPGFAALTYVFGGPVVHLAHGDLEKAGASLGVRLGLPFGGALVGLTAWSAVNGGTCHQELCGLGILLFGGIGAGVGAIGAVAADAAALAYERVPDTQPVTTGSPRARYKVEVRPTAGPRREGGFDVGVGGTW